MQRSILDVDGVLGEIATEQGELGDLKTALVNHRDRTVAHLNAGALITGSALGVAVSLTQFNTFSDHTQDVGTGVGIGAGIASTILSVMAVRRAHGPGGNGGERTHRICSRRCSAAILQLPTRTIHRRFFGI